jgi:hypothetical protein
MASRSQRGHKELTRVGSSVAVAVVIVIVLAAGDVPTRWVGPEIRTASARKETPHNFRPMTASPVTQRSTASSMTRPVTTTTRVVPAAKVTLPDPMTRETTTTTRPAQPAVTRRQSREACLALAAANHYEVIAANEVWYQQQLDFLAPHRALADSQFKELQIEEAQALLEIDAQYTIDKSNCYISK